MPIEVDTAAGRVLTEKGEDLYRKWRDQLSAEHHGKYLAIEVEARRYFIGNSPVEAFEEARKEFPNSQFFFVRIGYDYLDELSHGHAAY